MASEVGSVLVNFVGDAAPLTKGAKEASAAMTDFERQATAMTKRMETALKQGIGGGVTQFDRFGKRALSAANGINGAFGQSSPLVGTMTGLVDIMGQVRATSSSMWSAIGAGAGAAGLAVTIGYLGKQAQELSTQMDANAEAMAKIGYTTTQAQTGVAGWFSLWREGLGFVQEGAVGSTQALDMTKLAAERAAKDAKKAKDEAKAAADEMDKLNAQRDKGWTTQEEILRERAKAAGEGTQAAKIAEEQALRMRYLREFAQAQTAAEQDLARLRYDNAIKAMKDKAKAEEASAAKEAERLKQSREEAAANAKQSLAELTAEQRAMFSATTDRAGAIERGTIAAYSAENQAQTAQKGTYENTKKMVDLLNQISKAQSVTVEL